MIFIGFSCFFLDDFSLENIKYLKVKLEIEKEEEFVKNVMKVYD